MVNYFANARDQRLDATFAALADGTRRSILATLAERGEATVSEIAEPFDMSLPAVSKHLRVLERAGLLTQQPDGRLRRCRMVAAPLRDAAAIVEQYRRFWERQFDSLAAFLETQSDDDNAPST